MTTSATGEAVIDFEIDSRGLIQTIPIPKPEECVVCDSVMATCTGEVKAHFNPSVALVNGKYRMLYRAEAKPWFRTARVAYCELDDSFQPMPSTNKLLRVRSKKGKLFTEDPRWIRYGESWLMSYTDSWDMALASFDDKFDVVEGWYMERPPKLSPPSVQSEKNWAFFEWNAELYCVYKIRPHVVLRVDGSRTSHAHKLTGIVPEQFNNYMLSYGEPRGGASPIYHEGLFYHFFHSSHPAGFGRYGKIKRYHIGCYTFDPENQFKIVERSVKPLLDADNADGLPTDRPSGHKVIFVCGAMRGNDGWWLSYGHHDYRCRMTFIKDSTINANLKKV